MTSDNQFGIGNGGDPWGDGMRSTKRSLLWIGLALVALGVLAIAYPTFFTLLGTQLVGAAFLLTGGLMMIASFSIRASGMFFGALLVALLSVVSGAFLLFNPLAGAIVLTLMICIILIVEGAFQMVFAMEIRPAAGSGWMMASAIISIAAGVLFAAGLPGSSVFLLGLLLGVNFISTGIAFVAISRAI